MKKITTTIMAVIVFASILTVSTVALAYDGPAFPDAATETENTETTWKFFNPETVDLFCRTTPDETGCPYETTSFRVAKITLSNNIVEVYAYYDQVKQCESTWITDYAHNNSVNLSGHTYEGYYDSEYEADCIYLSGGLIVTLSEYGFEVSANAEKEVGFAKCPYDIAMLIESGEFAKEVNVQVYSYTYDNEPGVWLADDQGHTADFRGAGYFSTISNHTIQLTDGNHEFNVYPRNIGFCTEITAQ